MDIRCPRCGEPWDTYEFHDVPGMTYKQALDLFYKKGCGVVFSGKPCQANNSLSAQKAKVLREVLGDDVDGIAAMTEDFEF